MGTLYCEASDLLNLTETKAYTPFADSLLEKLLWDPRLIKGAASLWQHLYSFAKCNNALEVTIKYQTIANKLGKSTKTVSRYIKSLCEHGYLLNHINFRPDGGRSCYTFALRIPTDLLQEVEKTPNRKKTHSSKQEPDSPKKIQIENNFLPKKNENITRIECSNIEHNLKEETPTTSFSDSTIIDAVVGFDKTVQGGVDISDCAYITNTKVLLNNNTTVVVDKHQTEQKENNCQNGSTNTPENPMDLKNTTEELETQLNDLISQENTLIQQTIAAHPSEKPALYQRQRILTAKINTLKQRKEALLTNQTQQMQRRTQQETFLQTLHDKQGPRPIHESQIIHLRKTLASFNVPQETFENLTNEILFAVRFDSLARTKDSQKPLSIGHALNIALKLVRENRWETPARFGELGKGGARVAS